MPIGSPKPQTIASKKWNKKAGYKTKAFSLKEELLIRFSMSCEKNGKSQASVIAELMDSYAREAGL